MGNKELYLLCGRKSGKRELERRMVEEYLAQHPDVILKEIRLQNLKPKPPEPYYPEAIKRFYDIDKQIEESFVESQWLNYNPHLLNARIIDPGKIIFLGVDLASDKEK